MPAAATEFPVQTETIDLGGSDSAMIGFFAKLEGDPSITLQESELGEAVWFSREDVPDLPSTISVGQEMITLFKNGGDPFCQR